MNIPLPLLCPQCGANDPVDIHLNDSSPDWTCKNGHQNHGYFSLQFTIGYKILFKSDFELRARKDVSMSIIFAAMAFECEISFLFGKWTKIEAALRDGSTLTEEDIEQKLRSLLAINKRITATSEMMNPTRLDQFVANTPELNSVLCNFPMLNKGALAEDFQRTVFWPRNKILHFGYTGHDLNDAIRIFDVAKFGLQVLTQLDKVKYKKMFPAH